MKVVHRLLHLFVPRESNNHRAKVIHSSSILTLALLVLILQGILSLRPGYGPNVLGFAAQISPDEVVRLTNEKRGAAGLAHLSYNPTLSTAAYTKGRDMIDRDYWAHVAPDGTQPWKFLSDVGYRYKYAGENLARDFGNPTAAVDAWMNSPTHRDNILNPKYKEIGIGVVEGDLAGVGTTVIVQFFGATAQDRIVQPVAQNNQLDRPVAQVPQTPQPSATPESDVQIAQVPAIVTTPESSQVLQATQSQPSNVLVSPFTTTKSVSLAVVGLLLVVFIIDAIVVSRRKISRIAGRTLAHSAFLFMILVIVFIIKSGSIL